MKKLEIAKLYLTEDQQRPGLPLTVQRKLGYYWISFYIYFNGILTI
jgi:hypothetical protein